MKRKLMAAFMLLCSILGLSQLKAGAVTATDLGWHNALWGAINVVKEDHCGDAGWSDDACRIVKVSYHDWYYNYVAQDISVLTLPRWVNVTAIWDGVYGTTPAQILYTIDSHYNNGNDGVWFNSQANAGGQLRGSYTQGFQFIFPAGVPNCCPQYAVGGNNVHNIGYETQGNSSYNWDGQGAAPQNRPVAISQF